MTGITIRSNAKRWAAHFARRIKKLESQGKNAVRETVQFGKHYARGIAPNDSGATIRAIVWAKGKTPSSASIVFGNGHPEVSGRIGNFTKYMNEVPRGSTFYTHFKTGEPHFIEATSKQVKEKFDRKVRRVVNAFVNGK